MAKIIKEGSCCACCASMIANNDDSGCRDFYGHDHPSPYDQDHGGYLVITSESMASEVIVGPCELCGQGDSGYMEGHSYAVLSDDQEKPKAKPVGESLYGKIK